MLHAANSRELQTSRTHNYTYVYNFLTVVSGFIFVFYVHRGNTGGLQTEPSIFAGGKSIASLKTSQLPDHQFDAHFVIVFNISCLIDF